MSKDILSRSKQDSVCESQSNLSLVSDSTQDSRRSSMKQLFSSKKARRHFEIITKVETGLQMIFRRVLNRRKTLTDLEIQILSTITEFNRDEILNWYEKFQLDFPNGYMTRKEFLTMYKSLCPNKDVEQFVHNIFRAFDLDRSNTIDFREFLIGLSMTSTTSSAELKLEWLFQVFDIDGNGLLTRNECLQVIDTIARFNGSQINENNSFDIEAYVSLAKKRMMKMFDELSDNNSDTLTMTKFVQGCQKDDMISNLLVTNSESQNESLSSENESNISAIKNE